MGGSMGVAMCAGYPTGPVSREIRLTRWCRVLIINEPNFIHDYYLLSTNSAIFCSKSAETILD